jgi:holin-like protein
MLKGFAILLACLWSGSLLSSALGFTIPGPILGMLLLLALLLVFGISADLERTSLRLLAFMPLFILPASVGIVDYGALLREEWLALALSLTLSLCVSFWMTPLLFRYMCRVWLRENSRGKGS